MVKFCTQCGAQAEDTAFACGNCGAPFTQTPIQGYPQAAPPPGYVAPPPQGYPPPSQGYPPPPQCYPPPPQQGYPPAGYATAAPKKSSSAVKWILGILIFLLICGALVVGGLFYLAHKVKNKIEEAVGPGGFSTTAGEAVTGDTCRFLSATDVSSAIGVTIVSTKATSTGCEYYAKGTPSEMSSKHLSAMMKQHGADSQQQKMTETFSHILGAQQTTDGTTEDATAMVLSYAIDPNSARTQMRLNSKIFVHQPGSQELTGIGDEAFDASDAILFVRKGDRLIRITYTGCPCSTEAVKPLAKKLADQL